VREHLDACPRCRQEYRDVRSVHRALKFTVAERPGAMERSPASGPCEAEDGDRNPSG
jgi:predicted anti-sigma-YlaC factor YlaD